MKKVFVSTAIALLLLIVVAGTAFAAFPLAEARGFFYTRSTTIYSEKIRPAVSITITDLNSTVTYTGMLDGTSTLDGTLVVHADGSADFHGVETFTGKVSGVPGTVTFRLSGENDTSGVVQLTAVIVSATGGLTNMRGVLWKDGRLNEKGPMGSYTGRILFEDP